MPIKHGLSLIMYFLSRSSFGLASVNDAAAVLPVTKTWTWPEVKALSVAALSPNLTIFVSDGAASVISRSSRLPPVTPTVIPERSSWDPISKVEGAKAPE